MKRLKRQAIKCIADSMDPEELAGLRALFQVQNCVRPPTSCRAGLRPLVQVQDRVHPQRAINFFQYPIEILISASTLIVTNLLPGDPALCSRSGAGCYCDLIAGGVARWQGCAAPAPLPARFPAHGPALRRISPLVEGGLCRRGCASRLHRSPGASPVELAASCPACGVVGAQLHTCCINDADACWNFVPHSPIRAESVPNY